MLKKINGNFIAIFIAFSSLFYFTTGYGFVLTPQNWIMSCKKSMNTDSFCYGYYQGALESLFINGDAPCFNKSDKEVFNIAVHGTENFVKLHPKKAKILFTSTIIKNTLQKNFKCKKE